MNLPAVCFPALGTTAVLVTHPASRADTARAVLDEELAAIDLTCSRFRSDSELTAVNGQTGRWQDISPLLTAAVKTALVAARQSAGAVDPTVGAALRLLGYDRDFSELDADGPPLKVTAEAAPGWQLVELDERRRRLRLPAGVTIDLGATAKALAADRAAERAAATIGGGVLVSLGGDMALAGPPPPEGWTIRVTEDHRAGPDAPGQTVGLTGGGLATSSFMVRAWKRGDQSLHHIIDPATGWPADGPWRTVSTTAATCVDANTAATAALVRGRCAVSWLEGVGLPSRLVGQDGRVRFVAGWPESS